MAGPAASPPSQIAITLPDQSVKTLARGATGADIAKAIGPGLAKAALAIQVDGKLWDLDRPSRPMRACASSHARTPKRSK